MQTSPRLALSLALLSVLACGGEKHEGRPEGVAVELGRAPPQTEPAGEPAQVDPEPSASSEPASEGEPPGERELDDRQLALANVGRAAFDALKAGDFAALARLTPIDEGPLRDACPHMPLANRQELQARFQHCHRTIDWDTVVEAQIFAGQPSGAQALGCRDGIEDYGRLQMFLHMRGQKIWRVDFFGAVGQGGNAVGINGEVSCKEVAEAPPLK